MASKMLQFVSVDRAMPEKRGADDRRQDFDETITILPLKLLRCSSAAASAACRITSSVH